MSFAIDVVKEGFNILLAATLDPELAFPAFMVDDRGDVVCHERITWFRVSERDLSQRNEIVYEFGDDGSLEHPGLGLECDGGQQLLRGVTSFLEGETARLHGLFVFHFFDRVRLRKKGTVHNSFAHE